MLDLNDERACFERPESFVRVPLHVTASTIFSRFLHCAEERGGALAVRTSEGDLSYQELRRDATHIGKGLIHAVGAGSARVALLFGQTLEMVQAVLGTLAAGKTYVPLDASYPELRLGYMIQDCNAQAIVTSEDNRALAMRLAGGTRPVFTVDSLRNSDSPIHLGDDDDAGRPAYILYTSGSTGAPKGVVQSHANVLAHMRIWINSIGIAPEDKLSLQSAYGWDSAVQDTFGALLSGAALFPVDVNRVGINGLLDWYLEQEITVGHSTLPLFRGLADELNRRGQILPHVRVMVLGGDTIFSTDIDRARASFASKCVVVNAYGATESTTALMNALRVSEKCPSVVFPLGFPVDQTRIELIDESGLPSSVEGEVVVHSSQVALGYWGQAELTVAKFGESRAEADSRFYRTGDLARRSEDGSLVLVGRKDSLVKVRGIRVELSEIEGVLREHAGVRDAVVVAREDEGERILVAYLVCTGQAVPTDRLRNAILTRLPSQYVPSRFVYLTELPLTPNRKIDRAALPAPDRQRPKLTTSYVHATSALEKTIADEFRNILGLDELGVNDNFFDLGGNSLRFARLNTRLMERLGQKIALVTMYRHPTVRSLALALTETRTEDPALIRARERALRRTRSLQ